MLLLGCKPKGRHTEQHDIFITVSPSLKSIIPQIHEFWPDGGTIHIDAWREINIIEQHKVKITARKSATPDSQLKLYFLNLGGYKPGEFEEYHYKILCLGNNKTEAVQKAKSSVFYKHTGFNGANAHIDDKYGIDVDDLYQIEEILPAKISSAFTISLVPAKTKKEDDQNALYRVRHQSVWPEIRGAEARQVADLLGSGGQVARAVAALQDPGVSS
jgi:hypothetical protein